MMSMVTNSKLKIGQDIVGGIPVDMMDRLPWIEGPSERPGHDETVLHDIAVTIDHIDMGIIERRADEDVASSVDSSSALPRSMMFTAHLADDNPMLPERLLNALNSHPELFSNDLLAEALPTIELYDLLLLLGREQFALPAALADVAAMPSNDAEYRREATTVLHTQLKCGLTRLIFLSDLLLDLDSELVAFVALADTPMLRWQDAASLEIAIDRRRSESKFPGDLRRRPFFFNIEPDEFIDKYLSDFLDCHSDRLYIKSAICQTREPKEELWRACLLSERLLTQPMW